VTADQAAATADRIRVAIYHVDGRLVRILSGDMCSNGGNSLFWDGRDCAGRCLPPATYYIVLQASDNNGRELGSALKKAIRLR
jgi:flagellar hook assembly protein FlgD